MLNALWCVRCPTIGPEQVLQLALVLPVALSVQYVRREFRQLTDKDREAFLNALEAIYRLPTHRGRTIYGEDYRVRYC